MRSLLILEDCNMNRMGITTGCLALVKKTHAEHRRMNLVGEHMEALNVNAVLVGCNTAIFCLGNKRF